MSLNYSIVPLLPSAQNLTVLFNGVQYNLTLNYRDCDQGGWIMDIADVSGNPILSGIPFVTGADLLAQYEYLQFGGILALFNGGDPDEPPTFDNLGLDSQLYWVTAS
jgi:hypothetical protein